MPEKFPEPLERLINELSKLPTIGRKSAQRLAFHILKEPDKLATGIASALLDTKARVHLCPKCFYITDQELCSICRDETRDHSMVCVVEEPADVAAMERAASFNGVYHVLLGHLSPLHGVTAEDLKMDELVRRVEQQNPRIEEVVVATNPNVDGDATALYLGRILEHTAVKTTRLGLGLSIGSSLEYSDELTLRKAFESRKGV